MYRLLYISIFLGCGSSLVLQKYTPENEPKYFELSLRDYNKISSTEDVFEFKNPDSLITHQLQLLKAESGLPFVYYSDIQTPVCIDGLCKPVYVELFWDLLGNYIGYGEYENEKLSKFDHDIFETQDYLKLHELLSDKNSVLGRRRLSQLYDKNTARTDTITFTGVEIDGISGATRLEIKESIVEGGLYSCYTLWHLSHGPAVDKMRNHISSIYSPAVSHYFLRSNHEPYQVYALQKLDASQFEENIVHVVPAIEKGKPLTRSYLLKKMPKELYRNPLVIQELYQKFSAFDFNAKTLLLDNLSHSTPKAALHVTDDLKSLSKNQIKIFLNAVHDLQATDMLRDNLAAKSQDSDFHYGYMLDSFLELN